MVSAAHGARPSVMQNLPLTRELVLIGGGHTHALILKRWGMKPIPGVRVSVINPGPVVAYSGMLPGHVAGHYSQDALEIDLLRLARFAGARPVLGRAIGIDRDAKLIHVEGRPPLRYDIASIDIGIHSGLPEIEGFDAFGVAAKPLEHFAVQWAKFKERALADDVPPQMAIVGGGVAGAELAMAMAHALRDKADRSITLIDRGALLDELPAATRATLERNLRGCGIDIKEQANVARITETGVELDDGQVIASRFTLGAAGARPYEWIAQTGLACTDGYVDVDAQLQTSDPAIFAAGDCAHMTHAPRPKAGVFAVRAAPVLFDNLRVLLSDPLGNPKRLAAYHPQQDYLKLISLGRKDALAQKHGLRLQGRLLWLWKDRIDRKFMHSLKTLTPMQSLPLPDLRADGVKAEVEGKAPMCGGCGAKVGGDILGGVLTDLPAHSRGDVAQLAGDDAAVITHGVDGPKQVLSVDHLRAFIDDPVAMTRIAATHALGDVWSMGAAPQAALATVTLPQMTAKMQAGWLAEIMGAASEVFNAHNAQIVGGHTSMGAEFSIGFTVSGLTDTPRTLSGAKDGDALILTKAIGTGVLMAAEMQMRAHGRDIAQAIDSMTQSSDAAARLLAPKAHAMTDVTGFGLAGHLLGVCRASGVEAHLNLRDVPLLKGALALAQEGVASSLLPANRAYSAACDAPNTAQAELLFDPQTAGGLLAAIPESEGPALVEKLRDAGYRAAIIGRLTMAETARITVST